VLGIAPGLKSLAYSVMSVEGSVLTPVDHDILLGGYLKKSVAALAKKAYAHTLILDVVFERNPPTVLAIGPACNPGEPVEHLDAVRTMLSLISSRFGVRATVFDDESMQAALGLKPKETLGRAVTRVLGAPLDSADRRLVLAAGIALAGVQLLQQGRLSVP
jgi:Holliday junction resolvasome RuvABC endonuclease subunit